ncbi:hypothetical protein BACFIN_07751 [Bacteroides finegoldii DSM 17565]|nr:hypothetical protein BACFIN_07751 [Bacteroides finegoldii DSM 17565]
MNISELFRTYYSCFIHFLPRWVALLLRCQNEEEYEFITE